MNPFLVYGLVDPRTGEVRYVGKSSSGLARPKEHASRVWRENNYKASWIRGLLSAGLLYEVRILEWASSLEMLPIIEAFWVTQGRGLGWPLTNTGLVCETDEPRDRKTLPDSQICARYIAGESEIALAREYNVDRRTIRKRLLENGVEPRGRSAAMFMRMKRASPEERQRIALAANVALRGTKYRRHYWKGPRIRVLDDLLG
jgi:hypothetical protein